MDLITGSWDALPLLCFLEFFIVKNEFRKTACVPGLLKSLRGIETLVGLGVFILSLPFPDTPSWPEPTVTELRLCLYSLNFNLKELCHTGATEECREGQSRHSTCQDHP